MSSMVMVAYASAEKFVPSKVTVSPPSTDPNLGTIASSSGVDVDVAVTGFAAVDSPSMMTLTGQEYSSFVSSMAKTP